MNALYNFNLVAVQIRLRNLIMTSQLIVNFFTHLRYMFIEL